MNIFDRLVDEFSMKDLRQRVWSVVAIGAAICVFALIGGFFFFTSIYTISVQGTGLWSAQGSNTIEIQLNDIQDIERLQNNLESLKIEFKTPIGGASQIPVGLLSVDPQTYIVEVEALETRPEIRTENRFNVGVILVQKPYWQLLWEKK